MFSTLYQQSHFQHTMTSFFAYTYLLVLGAAEVFLFSLVSLFLIWIYHKIRRQRFNPLRVLRWSFVAGFFCFMLVISYDQFFRGVTHLKIMMFLVYVAPLTGGIISVWKDKPVQEVDTTDSN